MAGPTTPMDLRRLAAEVSAQHGIRIDPDDPMMAVVTLNRLVFEQAVAQVLDRVQSAVRDFETAAEKVQVRAGAVLAQEVRESAASLRSEMAKTFHEMGHPDRWSGGYLGASDVTIRWFIAGLAVALLLLGLGVLVGILLR